MGMTRRRLAGLAAALVVGVALAPSQRAAAEVGTRLVVVTHGQASDPYWSVVKRGVDDAAKTEGVKVEYISPDTFDMARMAQIIDSVVSSRPDGLVGHTRERGVWGAAPGAWWCRPPPGTRPPRRCSGPRRPASP